MIHHMFIFGVLIPTAITVVFFVGFLVCWFKFNIKEKLLSQQFFKKKKLKQGVCPKANDKLPNTVTFNKKEVKGHGHSGEKGWKRNPGDRNDPGEDGGGPLGYCNTAMSHSRPCSQCEDDRDTLSQGSGGQASGCPHRKSRGQYFVNPRLCGGDKELGQRLLQSADTTVGDQDKCCSQDEVEEGLCEEELIQQTFHFPDTDTHQLNCLSLEMMEEDSCDDDSNYGHFIPKAQIQAVEAADKARVAAMEAGPPGRKIYTGSLGQPPPPSKAHTAINLHLKQWQKHKAQQAGGVRFAEHCTVIPGHHTKATLPASQGDANELQSVAEKQRLVT